MRHEAARSTIGNVSACVRVSCYPRKRITWCRFFAIGDGEQSSKVLRVASFDRRYRSVDDCLTRSCYSVRLQIAFSKGHTKLLHVPTSEPAEVEFASVQSTSSIWQSIIIGSDSVSAPKREHASVRLWPEIRPGVTTIVLIVDNWH